MKSRQYNTKMDQPLTINQFTEIFILGYQHGNMIIGKPKNDFVGNAGFHFRYIENIMTIGSQSFYNLYVYAFVCKQVHAAISVKG